MNFRLDELFGKLQRMVDTETPGLQYQVVKGGKTAANVSLGLADIAKNFPVSEATQFAVYSVTKVVTAITILQLSDRGLLNLDDFAEDYVPGLGISRKIKIKHLLSQTSGLQNPIPTKWVRLLTEDDQFNEMAFLHSVLKNNRELNFEPGEKYQYSNISYWLLALILEKVVRQKFCDYVDQRVFGPLGLQGGTFHMSSQKPYATGYLKQSSMMNVFKRVVADSKFWSKYEKGWLRIEPCYVNGPGFGGLFVSSTAMATLIADILTESPKILPGKGRLQLFQQQFSNNGKPLPMSLGLHIGWINGVKYFYKEGGGMGFHAEIRIYPSSNAGTILLTNSGSFNTRKRLTELDKITLF
ncbi:MAG: beta-lactamase family protein [Bdellovibrionales bacterium]|nr:beta-lactamase family protein [Bdellovibrionales bacterium]